ncbi:MAG: chemotaxis protein CheC [Christensenellaceae bacterium]|jgi:chemotaxis protein CheC
MDINASDLDLLKEIGNIGAGNAASALSEMTDTEVHIEVPDCRMIGFAEIADMLGGPDHVILGILVQLSQEFEGFILLAQDLKDVQTSLKVLMKQDIEITEDTDISEFEPMREICNILVGAYISAIASLTHLSIVPSVPELTVDMAMAIMNVPALVYGEMGDSVLMLDTKFGGAAESIHGHFFLMPTMESLEKLKRALGL